MYTWKVLYICIYYMPRMLFVNSVYTFTHRTFNICCTLNVVKISYTIYTHGVASISRLLKMIGLFFAKEPYKKRQDSAKEPYKKRIDSAFFFDIRAHLLAFAFNLLEFLLALLRACRQLRVLLCVCVCVRVCVCVCVRARERV